MARPPISARLVWRYTLFQVPALVLVVAVLLALRHWLDLAPWVFWAVLGGWVVKDVVLFPFVRRAYDDRDQTYSYSVVGEPGVVYTKLEPVGRVRVKGVLWRGRSADPAGVIEAGAEVTVVEINGLELVVEPADEPEQPGS